MATAAYTGQTQSTTTGLVNAMAADASWCPAVQTCVVPSADSIQQLNATGSVTAWGSLVEIGATPLTANISVTLPSASGNVGKTVTFKRLDSTAFTVTLVPFAGDTGEVTTSTSLNTQFGALTVEAVSSTKYEQVSNISTGTAVPPTTNALSSSGGAIISTVDSVVASLTPAAGTIQDNLGFNAAGALVKAAPAATTNLLASSAAAITSTVDGVAATLTPAVGVIQDSLGFDAAGALVKAAPAAGGILVTDGVQTANRVQNFGTFSQTWNNVGNFTKNVVAGTETANYTDTFTPANAQLWSTFDGFNYSTNNGVGSSGSLYVLPTGGSMEISNAGGAARIGVGAGTVGAAAGSPQAFVKTAAVSDATAVAGQVLSLTSAITGEVEFTTLQTADTIQTAGTSGATAVTAWGSVVLLPTLTGNITLIYPTPVGNIGKTIKIVQAGVPNAFTITHSPLVGTVTFTNAAGELTLAGGAVTIEAMDATSARQVASATISTAVAVGEFSSVNLAQQISNSATFEDVTGSSLALTPGTWELIYTVSTDHSTGDNTLPHLAITDSANVVVPGSIRSRPGSNTSLSILSAAVQITVGTTATYKLRYQRGGGGALTILNSATGNSTFTAKKISGYLPVSGALVEYVTAANSANVTTNVAAGDHAKFDTVLTTGGVTLDTATAYTSTANVASLGRFTLKAGKTYKLAGHLGDISYVSNSTNYVTFRWFNSDANVAIGGQTTVNSDYTGGGYDGSGGTADAIFTPSVDTRVELRIVGSGAMTGYGGVLASSRAYAEIIQIGSTATTTTTRVVVTARNVSGQSIPNAATTALTGWTEEKDTASAFNATTGVFTAPRAADYLVSLTIGYNGFTSIAPAAMSAEVTGAISKGAYLSVANGIAVDSISPTLTVIVPMTINQTLTMQSFQNTGAARTLNTGSNRTHLSIMEIEASF